MARLTDAQKKQVVVDHANGLSLRAIAAKHGVTAPTIQRVLKNDPETLQIVTRKKEENVTSVLEFMDTQAGDVCGLLKKFIEAMGDQDKIDKATLPQVATALGIVIDKYTGGVLGTVSTERLEELINAASCVQQQASATDQHVEERPASED